MSTFADIHRMKQEEEAHRRGVEPHRLEKTALDPMEFGVGLVVPSHAGAGRPESPVTRNIQPNKPRGDDDVTIATNDNPIMGSITELGEPATADQRASVDSKSLGFNALKSRVDTHSEPERQAWADTLLETLDAEWIELELGEHVVTVLAKRAPRRVVVKQKSKSTKTK